jgi:hypothetical protein
VNQNAQIHQHFCHIKLVEEYATTHFVGSECFLFDPRSGQHRWSLRMATCSIDYAASSSLFGYYSHYFDFDSEQL